MTGGPGDAELLAEARAGSSAAFRALVERYQAVVASVVIGMLGPGDEVDDVGQETFIRFYRALDRFRGDAELATYLRRIAVNLSLNALKRRRRHRMRLVSRDRPEEPVVEPAVAPYDSERSERAQVVRAAIARLNEKHRAVVVLRLLEERSTIETAELLRIPAGTVMSRLARGMEELEALLAPYMGADDHDE